MNQTKFNLLKIKKFRKKSVVLRNHLESFLIWRICAFTNLCNGESERMRTNAHDCEQDQKKFSNLKKLNKTNDKLSSFVEKRMAFPKGRKAKEFFPHKKAFIHYWILPFVGFAGYAYLHKLNVAVESTPHSITVARHAI